MDRFIPEFFFRRGGRRALAIGVLLSAIISQNASAAPIVLRDINSYVLFAYNELVWKGGNVATDTGHIYGGNIGVNYPGLSSTAFSLEFGTSAGGIMSPGSQAVADSVRADDAADVFDTLFANTTNASFGATVNHPNPDTLNFPDGNYPFTTPIIAAASLPTLPFTPGRASTDGAANLTVGGAGGLPSPQSPGPGEFRDVRFNDNVVVNLGAGVYDMRDVSIGKNVTVNVTDATILQIDRGFQPNDGLRFGTNAGYAGGSRLYVGGLTFNSTTERATNFSHGEEIHAQYFAPNSWLDLGGGNELFGRFWALRITGDPNNNVHLTVPEPATTVLMLVGMLGVLSGRRR